MEVAEDKKEVMRSIEGKEESDKLCRLCKKTKPVILVCQNFQHKDALCKDCTRKVKTSLMGPAGKFASTNIYDFTVRKVDFEGRIHLFHMVCRRPPQQAIHWKTTNRLTLSSLVAIVKVPESNFGLKGNDPIIWGEITVHDQSKDEFKRREKGELVVSDLRDLKDKCDLHQGDNVVIIDCKTFVPEHIPVLKSLEELQLSTLPFNDGALLNLRLDNGKKSAIDFDAEFERLSGKRKAFHYQNSDESTDSQFTDSETELEPGSESDDEVADLIDFIIGESKIGPIMAIRRDKQQTIQLKQELKQLVKKKTLDREQLRGFIESLIEPVHLTQGPPGTGKSYLGVVIVQALIKI